MRGDLVNDFAQSDPKLPSMIDEVLQIQLKRNVTIWNTRCVSGGIDHIHQILTRVACTLEAILLRIN